MQRLLIATNNKGKAAELESLLKNTGIQVVKPSDINVNIEVVEDGKTYAENASKKALEFAHASGLISLADDSGLEVDALNGAPGLYSARYSPKAGATDADRRAYLLDTLRDLPHPWTARFHATVTIAALDNTFHVAEGNCYGEIIPEERGLGGFGYDPIFFIPEIGKTMAELAMDEKNRFSHRARAVLNILPVLEKLFGI